MTAFSLTDGHDEWLLLRQIEALELRARAKPETVDWDALRDAYDRLEGMLHSQPYFSSGRAA